MPLNSICLDMLTDLIEIKLAAMEISDREDHHDMRVLKQCLLSLGEMRRQAPGAGLAAKRPVGRPRHHADPVHAAM
jgi:hypothetical protein